MSLCWSSMVCAPFLPPSRAKHVAEAGEMRATRIIKSATERAEPLTLLLRLAFRLPVDTSFPVAGSPIRLERLFWETQTFIKGIYFL